jgi:hypothetical protein
MVLTCHIDSQIASKFGKNDGTATSLPSQIALQTTDLALLYKPNHQQHKGGSLNMPSIYCPLHINISLIENILKGTSMVTVSCLQKYQYY